MRMRGAWLASLVFGLFAAASGAEPIAGLDHMPLAVHDLDRAQDVFRDLGFAIKPGRRHDNGIRNAHVKFPDGSGIELLTAPGAVDALTTRYAEVLRQGEGPAYLALHVRDTARLFAALKSARLPYQEDDGTLQVTLPGLEWLFFVGDNRASSDRAEHFAHANGATAMSRVWVAPDDPASLRRVLQALGAKLEERTVAAPDPVRATVARLTNGELLILPPEHQLMIGRPIIGATFIASRAVAPTRVMGLWVEFRKPSR